MLTQCSVNIFAQITEISRGKHGPIEKTKKHRSDDGIEQETKIGEKRQKCETRWWFVHLFRLFNCKKNNLCFSDWFKKIQEQINENDNRQGKPFGFVLNAIKCPVDWKDRRQNGSSVFLVQIMIIIIVKEKSSILIWNCFRISIHLLLYEHHVKT